MSLFELQIFGLTIAPTWYGLMYALGFIISYEYMKKQRILRADDGESFFLMVFLGVILGGRIGYILLYDLSYYISHPIEIFSIWK
jgi:phosphatidylglycerol---prolipoprotein diacylglyceryl transferase